MHAKGGKVWRATNAGEYTDKEGKIVEQYWLHGPVSNRLIEKGKVDYGPRWEEIAAEDAEKMWSEQIAALPEFLEEDKHLISGVTLPIWDRLKGETRVYRMQTDAGERFLGQPDILGGPEVVSEDSAARDQAAREIAEERAEGRDDDDMSSKAPTLSAADAVSRVYDSGHTLRLANDWTIERRMVGGERRIEIRGPGFADRDDLAGFGVISERISYETRFFIPVGDKAAGVLEKVVKYNPIVEDGAAIEDDKFSLGPVPA